MPNEPLYKNLYRYNKGQSQGTGHCKDGWNCGDRLKTVQGLVGVPSHASVGAGAVDLHVDQGLWLIDVMLRKSRICLG
jgi:hypothetical protein